MSTDNTELNNARIAEIRQIERANNGVVKPEQVVEAARSPNSALHDAFCWDDDEAARLYRIEQARGLLRVLVEIEPRTSEEMRAFVAVKSERYEGGGYRHMPTVMRSAAGRDAVLETALWELQAVEAKYKRLTELAGVFAAIRAVVRRRERTARG